MTNESIIKKTILVIEDERPLSKVIVDKLERAGFEVLTARTVDQGLEYIEEVSSIDVVWLDHYLFGKKQAWTLSLNSKALIVSGVRFRFLLFQIPPIKITCSRIWNSA